MVTPSFSENGELDILQLSSMYENLEYMEFDAASEFANQ